MNWPNLNELPRDRTERFIAECRWKQIRLGARTTAAWWEAAGQELPRSRFGVRQPGGALRCPGVCRSKIRFSSVSCGDAVRSGSVTVFVYQTVED
ncbi:hypothetical protein ACIQPP_48145, partial [Streptomyces violaceusniger]|uniref:hypothetical protein n=1 Tax=Streptomyces violaceusniger TaxID=68280 RepID=UPI00380A8793